MSYAAPSDYQVYVGDYEDAEELEKLLDRASDVVDRATYNRIVARGFDSLSEYQQEMVTKATCLQASFIEQYGSYLNMPLSGFSAGSISVNFSKDNEFNGQFMDLAAINCLKNSGLTTRRL